jgi:tetratricopeptide (TPR) repeat protein
MNVRHVVSIVFALLFSFSVAAQQIVQEASGSRQPADGAAFKQDLERLIRGFEDAAHKDEVSHASNLELGKIYGQLGLLYEDAAQWERSESALEHAVSLLRRDADSKKELAKALSELGSLHVAMRKFRESEKEEQEGLRLGEESGDKLQIARSQDDLAALWLAQHKYDKARDFAQQAVAEFVVNERAEPYDSILSRYTLALADCHLRDYASAIPLLTTTLDEARAKMQPHDLPIGFGEFLLGYALWKSGDSSAASGHLEEGIAAMKGQLGWGHPAYLTMMGYYSKFLRETRQVEAANDVDRQIRRAQSVVDVRSLGARVGVNGFDGLH